MFNFPCRKLACPPALKNKPATFLLNILTERDLSTQLNYLVINITNIESLKVLKRTAYGSDCTQETGMWAYGS